MRNGEELLADQLPFFQQGLQVCHATGHGDEVFVVLFWNFQVVAFAKFHDDVEEVHGIEIELIPQLLIIVNVAQIFIGSDIRKYVQYRRSNFFFGHQASPKYSGF